MRVRLPPRPLIFLLRSICLFSEMDTCPAELSVGPQPLRGYQQRGKGAGLAPVVLFATPLFADHHGIHRLPPCRISQLADGRRHLTTSFLVGNCRLQADRLPHSVVAQLLV